MNQKQIEKELAADTLAEAVASAMTKAVAAEVRAVTKELRAKGQFPYDNEDFAEVQLRIVDGIVEEIDITELTDTVNAVISSALQALVEEQVAKLEEIYEAARTKAFPD